MKGSEFRDIRRKTKLTKNEFALELGYRGNERNNCALIKRYEQERKQIPLTVASLAWLLSLWIDKTGSLPEWPDWPGYELEKVPVHPIDDGAGPMPAINESAS